MKQSFGLISPPDWQNAGFALYIHWPFCESKCPYCDFNSHVAASVDQGEWQRAYLTEIDRIGRQTAGRRLDTVFFGGGTPSLMDPAIVATIIEKVRATWRMRNDQEVTLEANPGSIEAGRFRAYRDAGITRVSMGMQAMNDHDLKMLGRKHTAKEALSAFDIARKCFDRVSFDLIYARQDQDVSHWKQELNRALDIAVDHLSLYQLTIEADTAFADRLSRGGLKGLPNDELSAEMYELTQTLTENAGMPAYEISNHARTEAESSHNLIYWRGGDFAGIGPGAHGRLTIGTTRWATEAPKSPALWLNMVAKGLPGELPRSALTAKDHALEYLMMSLRLREGMSLKRYNSIAPEPLNPDQLSYLADLGMITADETYVSATPQGRIILNAVIRELAAD